MGKWKMASILKTANRKANRIEIGGSGGTDGPYMGHIWTCSIQDHILESFDFPARWFSEHYSFYSFDCSFNHIFFYVFSVTALTIGTSRKLEFQI